MCPCVVTIFIDVFDDQNPDDYAHLCESLIFKFIVHREQERKNSDNFILFKLLYFLGLKYNEFEVRALEIYVILLEEYVQLFLEFSVIFISWFTYKEMLYAQHMAPGKSPHIKRKNKYDRNYNLRIG